ncbi:hypothetical protein QBC47DRAFT_422748 [Echria macrotheca]|uniref:DUF8035 domain-containing protein n=1 Tax=Echria macrotheca TaxID=438768 RepID=A0AAJ0F9M2_9PEZI|nr:hypothetical protein QBC47DRAFT_422748 [Echria macrotheca]
MDYRSSVPELSRDRDRWDRDRFSYEQDRDRERDRFSEVRKRFEEQDDRGYDRPPRVPSRPPVRDPSERRPRRYDEEEDDILIRERRQVRYDDEPKFPRRRLSPDSEFERRLMIQRERERYRSPSPPRRRPGPPLRRQSSLDTFDRKPTRHFERDFSPPSRRDDYRIPPNVPIPLPRSKALPPPRVYAEREREFYEDIQISDPHRFGDDDFHPPERVREKEIIRERRRRSRSRSSRGTSRRSRSSSTSSSSTSGGTTITARSEYPKKGKTRIPARLVSKRALIEIGYPYTEEGNVIIVQKALGQQNIDDLLKLSDEYKKSELEILAARSSAGDIVEERRVEFVDVAPAHTHTQTMVVAAPPPPAAAPAPAPVEVVKTAVIRDVSPARSYTTTSYDSTTSYDTTTTGTSTTTATTVGPVVVDTRYPGYPGHPGYAGYPGGGEIVLAERPHRHHSRSRTRHGRHGSRDVVRAERLSTGELVLYEEEIERIEEPSKGVRIEKDRKGRMSIRVPKHR